MKFVLLRKSAADFYAWMIFLPIFDENECKDDLAFIKFAF